MYPYVSHFFPQLVEVINMGPPAQHQLCGSVLYQQWAQKNMTSWYILFGGLEPWIFFFFMTFHILGIIMNNHPNWRTHIFFRGVQTTNQYTLVATLLHPQMEQPLHPGNGWQMEHMKVRWSRRLLMNRTFHLWPPMVSPSPHVLVANPIIS